MLFQKRNRTVISAHMKLPAILFGKVVKSLKNIKGERNEIVVKLEIHKQMIGK